MAVTASSRSAPSTPGRRGWETRLAAGELNPSACGSSTRRCPVTEGVGRRRAARRPRRERRTPATEGAPHAGRGAPSPTPICGVPLHPPLTAAAAEPLHLPPATRQGIGPTWSKNGGTFFFEREEKRFEPGERGRGSRALKPSPRRVEAFSSGPSDFTEISSEPFVSLQGFLG